MTPEEWFDALESRLPPDRLVLEGNRALVRVAELFRPHLSAQGCAALEVARARWTRDEPVEQQLFDARIATWREVDAIKAERGEDSVTWLAARALVMLLFPPGPADQLVDVAGLFLDFCEEMGLGEDQIMAALGNPPE